MCVPGPVINRPRFARPPFTYGNTFAAGWGELSLSLDDDNDGLPQPIVVHNMERGQSAQRYLCKYLVQIWARKVGVSFSIRLEFNSVTFYYHFISSNDRPSVVCEIDANLQ